MRSLADENQPFSKRGVPPVAIGSWHLIDTLDRRYEHLEIALDGDSDLQDDDRRKIIQGALDSLAIPMLLTFATKDGIREHVAGEDSLPAIVVLRRWLESP